MNARVIPARADMSGERTRTVLTVMGMHSNSCRERLIEALEARPGVDEVEVNLQRGRATVSHSSLCGPGDLLEAAEHAGFHGALLASVEEERDAP